MNAEQLTQLATGLAPVVVEEVAAALSPFELRLRALEAVADVLFPLTARVKALEEQPPVAGPPGAPGPPGPGGADGFGLDDFRVAFDGERTLTLTFARGALVKTQTITIPALLYRGVYEDGRAYVKGDVVTWGGHAWIAKEDTGDKPGVTAGASRAWQLAVKAGRDGREGKPGQMGAPGPRGEKGDAVRFSS